MMKTTDNKLKILSVLLAIFMWTYVTNSTNPNVNKVYRGVPVVIKNQDDLERNGYTIIGNNDNITTTLKLKGSREKLIDLRPENIYASVDISDLKEGVQSLNIKVDIPSGINVEDADPSQITLNIQKVIEKRLPVNYVISDQIKDGKIVELNEINPKEITVKGPASLINKVDRAEVKIDDPSLIDGQVHNVNINILDRSGKKIANLDTSDEDANISFRVFETKRVSIKIDANGSINPSYEMTEAYTAPDSIVIKGPESIIKEIDEVSTEPINLFNLKTSKSGEVKLKLPESVEVYDGDDVVTYKIDVQRKARAGIDIKTEDEDDK